MSWGEWNTSIEIKRSIRDPPPPPPPPPSSFAPQSGTSPFASRRGFDDLVRFQEWVSRCSTRQALRWGSLAEPLPDGPLSLTRLRPRVRGGDSPGRAQRHRRIQFDPAGLAGPRIRHLALPFSSISSFSAFPCRLSNCCRYSYRYRCRGGGGHTYACAYPPAHVHVHPRGVIQRALLFQDERSFDGLGRARDGEGTRPHRCTGRGQGSFGR